jgi:PhoH-like ATPase
MNYTKQIMVLDTNVILHDAGCIFSFEQNDVIVPMTVLEELDRFKKGNDNINVQARQFLRDIDQIIKESNEEGHRLGESLGNIKVLLEPNENLISGKLSGNSADHKILNTALHLKNNQNMDVILVSKDVNLRMKAKTFGLKSCDYVMDKVRESDALYSGKRTINHLSEHLIDKLYQNGQIDQEEAGVCDPIANENILVQMGSISAMMYYDAVSRVFKKVSKNNVFGINGRNVEQIFALQALTNDDISLVTIAGLAGSGKTLLALAAALECRKRYRQILLARPVVALSNKDMGYLPGDINDKLGPYMQPLWDNLSVIKHSNPDQVERLAKMKEENKIEISPLAYIRGRSLQRTYFIIDEAQNLTPHEVKTIITRAGEGTKIILTGDVQQIDHPYLDISSNGLSYVIKMMRGQDLYSHITLTRGVRSRLAEIASNLL